MTQVKSDLMYERTAFLFLRALYTISAVLMRIYMYSDDPA